MNDNCMFLPSIHDFVAYSEMLGYTAIDQIFRVIKEQSQGSWDADFNFISYYNWTGTPGQHFDFRQCLRSQMRNLLGFSLSPMVNNNGVGEPKGYTG
jgi:uncharacterized protein